jgi:hypothetical protein
MSEQQLSIKIGDRVLVTPHQPHDIKGDRLPGMVTDISRDTRQGWVRVQLDKGNHNSFQRHEIVAVVNQS